ncbi:MAG: phosphomannomutase [Pseudomonadota bacterium]
MAKTHSTGFPTASGVSFGTSGLRGPVAALTPEVVAAHARAFLTACCGPSPTVWLGHDLRPSSPDIAEALAQALVAGGARVVRAGALPTPALALAAAGALDSAVMVTGSHIPADRNGIKFYKPGGEITKADEHAITAALTAKISPGTPGQDTTAPRAAEDYLQRYQGAFGSRVLRGLKLGVYSHSAVGRDLLISLLRGLGAEVVELGRTDTFVPVDTEAVDAETRTLLRHWSRGLDAILSTDGDGDRPLIADASGAIVPGDILGQITAKRLGATCVVTPVSSNSSVSERGFEDVRFTAIGSPYVLAAMAEARRNVVGYEANGGFILGFDARGPRGTIPALMTRDAVLPMLTSLWAMQETGHSLADLAAKESLRHRSSALVRNVSAPASRALLDAFTKQPAETLAVAGLSREAACDLTDGVRMTDGAGRVLHLRPSGNAPEFRIYTEAPTAAEAQEIADRAHGHLAQQLGTDRASKTP